MNKVEKFKINKDGQDYLKKVKALAVVKQMFASKKKQLDMQSSMLGKAIEETHKKLLQATQIDGADLTHDIALQEENHA